MGLFPRWWLPNFQRPDIIASRRFGVGDGSGEGHKCSGCGKTYLWRSTLTRHRQYECGGKEPMHQCPHCSYRARQRGNLGVHIRKYHSSPLINHSPPLRD